MREITKERIAQIRKLRERAHKWWASTVPAGQHDDYRGEAIPQFCTAVSKLLDDLDRALDYVPPIGNELASKGDPIMSVHIEDPSETKTKTRPKKKARKK